MPIPIQAALVDYDALKALETAFEQTQASAHAKADELLKLSADFQGVVNQRDKLASDLTASQEANANLAARLLEAQKPAGAAKITRQSLPRIYGFTIEKSKESPSNVLYAKVRTAMKWGASTGFNYWRGFFNTQEIADHLRSAPPYGNLVTYGQSLGLRPIADTIDTIALKTPDDTAFKIYLDSLARLGFEGVYLNDANRSTLPLDALKAMVARIRRLAPDMPIFASLLATADLATYKAIVDHVEIQTFGTPSEFERFLTFDDKLAFPAILCLDARTPMSAADLAKRAALIMKNPPHALFYYADFPDDYDKQPDEEDIVIRGLVSLLKAR